MCPNSSIQAIAGVSPSDFAFCPLPFDFLFRPRGQTTKVGASSGTERALQGMQLGLRRAN
jgi:hypothetical protein